MEGLENPFLLLRRDADPRVRHPKGDLAVARSAHRKRNLAFLGELESVRQQVFEDLFDPLQIGLDDCGAFRRDVDLETERLVFGNWFEDLTQVVG